MNNKLTKNDEAWQELFEKFDILYFANKNGFFKISSSQIKSTTSKREPRLMTKFDHLNDLPLLFKKHNLSILPISRGVYSISNYKVYHKFEEIDSPIEEIAYPRHIQSIDWNAITSESTAINVAYITDMLNLFLDEDRLLPTVNGRMGSRRFSYSIYNSKIKKRQTISVDRSQIEIDGGFEGVRSLSIIEAKNVLSEDFLVRQIYYPYRLWHDLINKLVRPIYLTYSNSVYSLYEYCFEQLNDYNSLKLVKSQRYRLAEEPIILDDLLNIYHTIEVVEEDMKIPFIQADSFYRIINMCELLLKRKSMITFEIALEYGFAERQSDYYFNAGRYIDLFDKENTDEGVRIVLSNFAKNLMKMSTKNKNLTLTGKILSHNILREVFKRTLEGGRGYILDKEEVVEVMKRHRLNMGKGSIKTYERRASSVIGWIKWIFALIGYY